MILKIYGFFCYNMYNPIWRIIIKIHIKFNHCHLFHRRDGDLSKLKEAILLDESGITGINEEFLKIWSHPNLWKAKSSRVNSRKGCECMV